MTESAGAGHGPDVNLQPRDAAPGPCPTAPPGPSCAALFEAHYELVWRTLRRLGVAQASVDDAVQDVFLVVHRRVGGYQERGSERAWLVSIAVRVAADYRRRFRRKEDTEPLAEVAVTSQDPHQSAERAEARALVQRLLESLSDELRTVFVLAEMEQLTAPEIAGALGVKLNTVYSRLRLARERFEKALSEHKRGEP